MKCKKLLLLSALLLNTAAQAATPQRDFTDIRSGFLPAIKGTSPTNSSPSESTPNSPGNSSQASAPAVLGMERSQSSNDTQMPPIARSPQEKITMLLAAAKANEANSSYMNAARQYQLLSTCFKEGTEKQQACLRKTAHNFNKAAEAVTDPIQKEALLREALNNYAKANDTANTATISQQLESINNARKAQPEETVPQLKFTLLNAQTLMELAKQNIEAADEDVERNRPFFPAQGQNIATPKAVRLKAQAATYYKQAGDIFAENNRPGDAAICYENSASTSCYAQEKIKLLKLSAQQHLAANNPAKAESIQKTADIQARSLAAHKAKMAAKAERRAQ